MDDRRPPTESHVFAHGALWRGNTLWDEERRVATLDRGRRPGALGRSRLGTGCARFWFRSVYSWWGAHLSCAGTLWVSPVRCPNWRRMAAEPAEPATRTPARPSRAGSFLLVALSAALWGTDALFRRGLALELPAAAVVFGEHLILVLLTLPLLIGGLRATRSFNRADWASLVLIGAGASATATVLFTAAFALGDPTTPLLLQKVQPLIAIAGAWLLLGERPLRHYLVYLVAGVAGAYLISFPDPGSVSISAFVPAALALGAAALWGMGTVLGRHLTTKVAFAQLTALRFATGLPASAVLLWMLGGAGALGGLTGSDLLALLLLALVPGLLALLLYYRGLRGTPAAAATLAELAFPLSAVLINYAAFGTTLAPTQWLGVALLSGTITLMGIAGQRGERGLGVAVTRRAEHALAEP